MNPEDRTNHAKALLHGRRSIRRYREEAVGRDAVETLLRAAMAAPSAKNLQPWHFVVVTDRSLLDSVPAFHPYARMILKAPLAVCVCGDASIQPLEGYWVQDCAAATENLLLAAHGLGLGAVWLGIHPRPERIEGVTRLLALPAHVRPLALVCIGWPDEVKEPEDRYDAARVHDQRWGEPWA